MQKWLLAVVFLISCTGPAGHDGAPGQPGTPGTQITPVQFCTNYHGAYPGPLPEFGQCENGVIYATCWDGHNAWTCEVYPGAWTTTATGAPCNFTVYPNCVVVDQ